jgi:predicted outer membrane repeat protein
MTFDLECDHDYVEILDALTGERLWKGGCVRTGRFVFQAQGSVVVAFTSDDSVTQEGFEMHFEVDGETETTYIPPPGTDIACSRHGRIQSDGTCSCSVGFTGEGCNNRVVCCSDPQKCHNAVCDMDPAKVIVVSKEFGNDEHGTGEMMDASEQGTASKAVKTLSRAVELSEKGSVILVYPGIYQGALNRGLAIRSTNITITTLKGPYWTTVDCEELSRFVSSVSSTLVVEGLTIRRCTADKGGAFLISEGGFMAVNMLITDIKAIQNGGAVYATGSNVSLSQLSIVKSSADNEGGALYFEDSVVSMVASNVTKCASVRGGAMALRGASSLTTIGTEFTDNEASDSGGGGFLSGNIALKGVVLMNNNAQNGGGLAMDSGEMTMESCVCSNNTAEIAGGGLALSGTTTLTVTGTSIVDNECGSTGGGIYATNTIDITFNKQATSPSTIAENSAGELQLVQIFCIHNSFSLK